MCLSVNVLLLFKKEKQAKSLVGNFVSLRSGLKKEFWEVPIIAGGWGHPPLQKAAVFGVGADVSSARGPLPAKQHSTGQASSRGEERDDDLYCVLSKDGKDQRSPGFVSKERQRSSRQPRTPLRGALSWGGSAHPARAVQLIDSASAPLPLAGQSWEGCPAGREKRAWCKQL